MFEPIDKLLPALRAAGWLANEVGSATKARAAEPGVDLLPMLRDESIRATESAESAAVKQRAMRLTRLFHWLTQQETRLTLGWPGLGIESQLRWMGCRLMWWPGGIASGRKVAWVSSRLGRALEERSDWFGVLRTAATKVDPDRDLLLTASSTTTDRFLERAAILFGLRSLRIEIDERRTLTDWLLRWRRRLWRECLAAEQTTSERFPVPRKDSETVAFSPCLDAAAIDPALNGRPISDRVLLLVADQIVALQVRANGNLHELLRQRLNDARHESGSVWLAWGDQLVPREIVNELQPLGAVSWHLQPGDAGQCDGPVATGRSAGSTFRRIRLQPTSNCRPINKVVPAWPWDEGKYLVHWTRRRRGAWPDQSASEFVDDLLLSRATDDSSEFAALARIVQQQKLRASANGIRGGFRIVSFSATPFNELSTKRTFRAHRQRFDFEPFGLGLRRDWLIARGAHAVRYGDDSLWATLSDAERPYFQLRQTRGRHGATIIDWSLEAEWRVIGDVDLSDAGESDIALFVPNESDAKWLAAMSPWPVVVVLESPRFVSQEL